MNPAEFLPLKPAEYVILLLLADEPTYGVRLLERMDAAPGHRIRVNAGSLYRLIARLVDDGLIRISGQSVPEGAGAPRKIYALTSVGEAVLREERTRQAELLAFGDRIPLRPREAGG